MTTFRCPSDILFTSCWLFTTRRSVGGGWPKEGRRTRCNVAQYLWLPLLDHWQGQTGHRGEIMEGQNKERIRSKRQTQRFGCCAICERTKWGIHENWEYWSTMASPQLTVLTVHYGISWFIQRTRSNMRRKPSWSTDPLQELPQFLHWGNRQEARPED